jgi:16S rRNA (cytosine967-C5)-methyltransferase
VLDYCAGAGGKALALAATMENQGRLLLSDRDGRRLARAGPRLQRAGVEIAECQPNVTDDKAWLLRHAGYFDIVLTDAPCSGSGAWRRQPEGKWRISPERLAELTLEQAAILDRAAALTRIGGRLVYITCSLLPEENEAGIERFLGNWAGTFDLDPIDDEWRRRLDPGAIDQSGFVRLTPGRHATDGFFIAILKRKGQ